MRAVGMPQLQPISGVSMRHIFLGAIALCLTLPAVAQNAPMAPKPDTLLPGPLTTEPGNPARGRLIVRDLDRASCLICHALPIPEEPDHGTIGPPLHGIGAHLSVAEMRQRIIDPKAANPDTIMPSYYRTTGLRDVLEIYRGRPIYTAQQVEDVVAYMATLTTTQTAQ